MNQNLIPLTALPDAAVIVGTDGVVRDANERAALLLGVSGPADLCGGRRLSDFVTGALPDPWDTLPTTPHLLHVRVRDDAGDAADADAADPIRITATASAWGKDENKRALFVLRPARRWSDAPAPASLSLPTAPLEREYQAVFEDAKDGMFHFDAHNGAIRDVNQALCDLLGYTKDELCRLTLFDIVAHSEENIRANILNTFATGNCALGERRYRRRDGSQVEVEVHVVRPRRATDAGEASVLFAVVRDIRERKRAEAALQESQTRVRTIIDTLPVVMFALDENGVFTFSDGKALSQLGLMPGDVVGLSVFDVYRNDAAPLEHVKSALSGGPTYWTSEVGGVFWETTVTQAYGPGGEFRGLFGVSVDATERRHLQAQVIQSEKLAAIGQLVAGVAHEINNPLAAISGNAQLLEMHEDPQVREDAQSIRRMTGRANRVVRSLLTFARGADAGVRMARTLRAMVEETLELAAFTLKKGDVELVTRFAPSHQEPIAMVNDNQIQQVILNLLTNAEYALRDQGAPGRRIVIETRTEDDEAILSVSDNGCGIAPDMLSRIFDPFFTTKNIGDGTGLGLSICHGIVEAHDGRLTVESAPGKGTTFFVRLPLATLTAGGSETPAVTTLSSGSETVVRPVAARSAATKQENDKPYMAIANATSTR